MSIYPTAPNGVSVDANMKIIKQKFGILAGPIDYYWFYEQVRNKGPWDFKQQGGNFENFGNFHYGAVGYAGGIPENILLRAAGCAQMKAGTSLDGWDRCWGEMPFGDDPKDQHYIQLGIDYAKSRGY